MELKTYDTILTQLCDNFDELISPKTLFRSNANIIYLIFKAIAKAEEVINNICVKVSNKFDPANCTVEDLDSVASLVGTERLAGSGSGVLITATNNGGTTVVLQAGKYGYAYNEDLMFIYEQTNADGIEIAAQQSFQFVAITDTYGSFPVTAQGNIEINVLTEGVEIPDNLSFAIGTSNDSLLGEAEESDVAFRKRILSDTTRQDSLIELQNKIKSKPYIFDCRLKFNNTLNTVEFEGIEIPPYYLAIFYQGDARNELAELVAENTIYPTVATNDSVAVHYESSVFLDAAGYTVNLIPFEKLNYTAEVTYKIDPTFTTSDEVQSKIRSSLYFSMNRQIHQDYIKEAELYNVINDLSLEGLELLNIDLYVDDMEKQYITVPLNKIAVLSAVTFQEVTDV